MADTVANLAAGQTRPHAQTKTLTHAANVTTISSRSAQLKNNRRKNNMSDKRQAIRDAEEKLEDIFEDLENDYGVRVFRVYVNSAWGEKPQVNIVQDLRGGASL